MHPGFRIQDLGLLDSGARAGSIASAADRNPWMWTRTRGGAGEPLPFKAFRAQRFQCPRFLRLHLRQAVQQKAIPARGGVREAGDTLKTLSPNIAMRFLPC